MPKIGGNPLRFMQMSLNAQKQEPGVGGYLLLTLVALISACAFLHLFAPLLWLVVLFLGFTLYQRDRRLVPCALLFFFMYQGGQWLPAILYSLPTAPFLVPAALALVCCLPFTGLRAQFKWFRKGSPDQVSWFLVVLTSLVSALALVLWALWTDYLGIASTMLSTFRQVPVWFMVLVGIPCFALLNAFAEEVVYRGILQDALEKCFGEKQGLILMAQASAFAAAHYVGGFPNGKTGYLMTFAYALMLGYLRDRSRGMLAPYLAHVAADYVIGLTLLLLTA
jgi:membrane protease YdiL (CAAX protease family)